MRKTIANCFGLALVVVLGMGCRACRNPAGPTAAPLPPGPAQAVEFPGTVTPPTGPGGPGVPFVPQPPAPASPASPAAPGGFPTAPVFPESSKFSPTLPQRVEYRWEPVPGSIKLYKPEPIKPESEKKSPVSPNPPAKTKEVPDFPSGIAGFNLVLEKERITGGRRPSLEGLEWLQAKDYRALLFLHAPEDNIDSDRELVKNRGMKFLSLPVSPQTLSKKTIADFKALVQDPAHQPLFVYDRDGSLAGGVWYLYFRLYEQIPDDAARVRAGLREDANPNLWLAIQKILSQK